MGFQTRLYVGYILFLVAVMMAPMLLRDVTIDYKLFDFDLSEPDMLRKVAYHLGLMLQPTVLCWIIYTRAKGVWRIISLISFLWFCKDCIDVILHNNKADTFWLDVTGLTVAILIALIWARIKR